MKQLEDRTIQVASTGTAITVGDYACMVLQEQYQSMVKQEPKVLADEHPEHLHRMRVATRRLRTALQVFKGAIAIPKSANANRIGALARTLGQLRDLDVQIADLETIYRPMLQDAELQGAELQDTELQNAEIDLLDEAIAVLKKKRRQALAAVEDALGRSRYRDLKATYEHWFDQPVCMGLAPLPLMVLLPELLSPLLAELLLHPGWLVPANYTSSNDGETLHDLRKAFKHVRYEAEFFLDFYGKEFQSWVNQIKALQEKLGKLQDSHVLLDLLKDYLPKQAKLPTLEACIHQNQADVLSDWDTIRQQYLDPDFRRRLHQMILEPAAITATSATSAKSTKARKPTASKIAGKPKTAARISTKSSSVSEK